MFIYRIYVNKVKKIAVLFKLSDGLNRTNCSDKYPFGGANGARTRHLIHAMDALSQMSYCPIHKKILQYIKKIINQKLHLNKQRCSLNFIKINEFDLLKVNHLKHVVFLNFQYFVNLILF